MFQNGANSNNNLYLALSGFEVWGSLVDGKQRTLRTCSPEQPTPEEAHPMGNDGLIYFLGSKNDRQNFVNPALTDQFTVTSSSVNGTSKPVSAAAGMIVMLWGGRVRLENE